MNKRERENERGREGGREDPRTEGVPTYCVARFLSVTRSPERSRLCTIPFIHCSLTFTIRYTATPHHPLPVISRYASPSRGSLRRRFSSASGCSCSSSFSPLSRLHRVSSSSSSFSSSSFSSSSLSSSRFTRGRSLICNRAESISVFCTEVPPSNASCTCLRRDILVPSAYMRREKTRTCEGESASHRVHFYGREAWKG